MRKMGAQSMWIDDNISDSDIEIKEEINYLKRYYGRKKLKVKVYKLYFVREKASIIKKSAAKKLTYLSYSVIVNYAAQNKSNSYLLFSVVALPQKYGFLKRKSIPVMNYYVHSSQDYNFKFTDCDGRKADFTIHGTPFFQKNDATTFCIQAALATVLNNMVSTGSLILPNKFNDMLRLSFNEKGVGQGGYMLDQTRKVIRLFELHTKDFDFHRKDTEKLLRALGSNFDWPPTSILYHWMESGLPGLIIFRTLKDGELHVVPIIGHTLNTDRWPPEADIHYKKRVRLHFRPVSAWVDNFIIHDDNLGMYMCYPTSKLSEKKRGKGYLIQHVLFIMPDHIRSLPHQIEITIIRFLRSILRKGGKDEQFFWLNKLANEDKAPLVSRTLIVSKNEYIDHLRKPDAEGKKILDKAFYDKIYKLLPEIFWLTEISLPDLYSANKTALVSVVTSINTGNLVFVRLPNFYIIPKVKNGFDIQDLETVSHFKIFVRNEEAVAFEW
jgi:hypothetical protein